MPSIEDYGRKVGGARKDLFASYLEALASELSMDVDELAQMNLSAIFPLPDYERFSEAGVSNEGLAIVAVLRNGIPAKPSYSRDLLAWRDTVMKNRESARLVLDNRNEAFVRRVLDNLPPQIKTQVDLVSRFEPSLMGKAATYSFRTNTGINADRITIYRKAPSASKAKFVCHGFCEPGEEARDVFVREVARVETASANKARKTVALEDKALTKLRVYGRGPYSVRYVQKGADLVIRDGFVTVGQAQKWVKENRDLVQRMLKDVLTAPREHLDRNLPRVGPARRKGDVSAAQLSREFGLSGVEFGNYVEEKRRQSDLNRTWDSLCDLAEVTGIARKDVGLNGALALAFGSRGNGHAAAHYEPSRRVINLTKTSGAGALAHEWFHAWDNAITIRNDNVSKRSIFMGTESPQQALPGVSKALEELAAVGGSYLNRMQIIDSMRSKPYWSTPCEMGARVFEALINDRLEQSGRSNDHLVSIDRRGGAYPDEHEEKALFAAMEKLFPGTAARKKIEAPHADTNADFQFVS